MYLVGFHYKNIYIYKGIILKIYFIYVWLNNMDWAQLTHTFQINDRSHKNISNQSHKASFYQFIHDYMFRLYV